MSVPNKRATSVQKRELTELQRKAIRFLIASPGISYKNIGDRLHVDRTVVSRWVNHDATFQEELEKARSEPQLTAEDVLNRMGPEEREKLKAALIGRTVEAGSDDGPDTKECMRLLRRSHSIVSEEERAQVIVDMIETTMNLGARWNLLTGDDLRDIKRLYEIVDRFLDAKIEEAEAILHAIRTYEAQQRGEGVRWEDTEMGEGQGTSEENP
jgi:hypothetical protein